MIFFALRNPVDRAQAALRLHQVTTGLCASLGDSEAWKPQKVGGCGWTRCPRNSVVSHRPKIRPVLGFGVLVHIAQILGLFGALWNHFSDISRS